MRSIRVTVGNLKGGTGKSTTAVNLALWLGRDGRVLLVDADEANQTTYEWSDLAGDDWPSAITVVRWPSVQLAKRVRDVEGTYQHLVIDTGPHDAAVLRSALQVTDLLLVPLAPTSNEVVRVRPTLQQAAEVGVMKDLDLLLLLNRVVPNTVSRREVRTVLEGQGHPVMHAEVNNLQALATAMGRVPEDLGPYEAVGLEIADRLDPHASKQASNTEQGSEQ